MKALEGLVVFITGSSRGIGAGLARAVYNAGAHPIITYQSNRELAEQLAAELDDALVIQLEMSRRESIQQALSLVEQRFGRLDVVVNNAGILEQKPFLDITEDEWDETLAVNLKGPFMLTQEAVKLHRKLAQQDMRIVNMSSVGGQFGGPKAPHYAASKGALLTLTKSCARLFAEEGIRVNAIAPGFIKTEMYEHILEKQSESAITAGIPIGYVGKVEDVASALIYLASDAGSYVTGQVLNVNGGSYMG